MGQEVNKCTCLRKLGKEETITADLNENSTSKSPNISEHKELPKKIKKSKLKLFQGLLNFAFCSDAPATPEIKIQSLFRGFIYRKHFNNIKEDLIKENQRLISEKKEEFISSHIIATEKFCKEKYDSQYVKSFYQDNDEDIGKFKTGERLNTSKMLKTDCLLKIFDGYSSLYIGQVDINNDYYGEGVLYSSLGSKYDGNWVKGDFVGWGKYFDPDGVIYEGRFSNGVVNGKGIKITHESTYVGDLKNSLKEGFGKEETAEHIYEGQFKNDKKNGQGKLKYKASKDSYEGEFLDNNITGHGFYVWENQHTYLGDFLNGKMHGKGVYKWPDKSEYEGEYQNGLKEGQGVFKWNDGRIFKGSFHNGKPDGVGKLTVQGLELDAEFKAGKLQGDLKEMYKKRRNEIRNEKGL